MFVRSQVDTKNNAFMIQRLPGIVYKKSLPGPTIKYLTFMTEVKYEGLLGFVKRWDIQIKFRR